MKSLRKKTPNGKQVAVIIATDREVELLIEAVDSGMTLAMKVAPSKVEPYGDLREALLEARYGRLAS